MVYTRNVRCRWYLNTRASACIVALVIVATTGCHTVASLGLWTRVLTLALQ